MKQNMHKILAHHKYEQLQNCIIFTTLHTHTKWACGIHTKISTAIPYICKYVCAFRGRWGVPAQFYAMSSIGQNCP